MMRNFLSLLGKLNVIKPATNENRAGDIEASNTPWQSQYGVYYLLDTIKLCYRSVVGEVTIEKIPLAQLNDVVKTNLPLIAEGESYSVSVCAVSTETYGEHTRTKAIANAALFRARAKNSQALLQDAGLPLDRVADELTQYDFKRGITRLNNISLIEFIEQLKQANKQALAEGRHRAGIKSENFDSLFSESEQMTLRKYGI